MTPDENGASTAPSSRFSIDGFRFTDGVFEAHYSISDERETVSLTERVDFSAVGGVVAPDERLLRLLALACSTSYYKATTATTVTVGFALSAAERNFLAALIENGLTEYAYRNDRIDKLTPTIECDVVESTGTNARSWAIDGRPVVAVGGGKDSIVTIEALKRAGKKPLLFSVNQFDPIDRCVAVSGCDYVRVRRTIDPEMRALNERGALNGHIPVTAINSVIGLIVADILDAGPLVMSNERSANYGNLEWHGRQVNHQWSKSLEFEDLLRRTLETDGLEPDRYFSLLRSFRELDIARMFAQFPQYFVNFTSCNQVYKIDPANRSRSWCGVCPKCHFVFLILAPYMSQDALVDIFGFNLLDVPENVEAYEEILGLQGNKPFECVGEYDEAAEALRALSTRPEWSSNAVVSALAAKAAGVPTTDDSADDRVPAAYIAARDGIAAHD